MLIAIPRNANATALQIPSGKLPDPESLQNWMSEEDGITSWPPTMALDIGKYLQSLDNIPLKNRLMSDFKDGKAYSYFASGWVKEIFYHAIDETSEFCFFKTEFASFLSLPLFLSSLFGLLTYQEQDVKKKSKFLCGSHFGKVS